MRYILVRFIFLWRSYNWSYKLQNLTPHTNIDISPWKCWHSTTTFPMFMPLHHPLNSSAFFTCHPIHPYAISSLKSWIFDASRLLYLYSRYGVRISSGCFQKMTGFWSGETFKLFYFKSFKLFYDVNDDKKKRKLCSDLTNWFALLIIPASFLKYFQAKSWDVCQTVPQ